MQSQLLAAFRTTDEAQQQASGLQQKLQDSQDTVQQLEEQCKSAQQQLQATKDAGAARDADVKAAVARLAKLAAISEMQLETLQLQAEGNRIGQLGVSSGGIMGLHEVWEDGQAFRDLQARLKALAENRASIEAARKVLFSIRYVHCPGGQLGPNRPKNQFSEFCGSTQGCQAAAATSRRAMPGLALRALPAALAAAILSPNPCPQQNPIFQHSQQVYCT